MLRNRPWVGTVAWDLNEGLGPDDGTRSVYAQLENAVGFQSAILEDTVVFDRTPPAIFGTTGTANLVTCY